MSDHVLQIFESVDNKQSNKMIYITVFKNEWTLDEFLLHIEAKLNSNHIRKNQNKITKVSTASKLKLATMRKNLFKFYETMEPQTLILNQKHG